MREASQILTMSSILIFYLQDLDLIGGTFRSNKRIEESSENTRDYSDDWLEIKDDAVTTD